MAVHFADVFEHLSGWNASWQTTESWASTGPKDTSTRDRYANGSASEVSVTLDALSSQSVFVAGSLNPATPIDSQYGGMIGVASQSDSSEAMDSGAANSNSFSESIEPVLASEALTLSAAFIANCPEALNSSSLERASQIAGAAISDVGYAVETSASSQASNSTAAESSIPLDALSASFSALAVCLSSAGSTEYSSAQSGVVANHVAVSAPVDLSSAAAFLFVALGESIEPEDIWLANVEHLSIHKESEPVATDGAHGVSSLSALNSDAANAVTFESAMGFVNAQLYSLALPNDDVTAIMFAFGVTNDRSEATDGVLAQTNAIGAAHDVLTATDAGLGYASLSSSALDFVEPIDAVSAMASISAAGLEKIVLSDAQVAVAVFNGAVKNVAAAQDAPSASANFRAELLDLSSANDSVIGRLVISVGELASIIAGSAESAKAVHVSGVLNKVEALDSLLAKQIATAVANEITATKDEVIGHASCLAESGAAADASETVRYIEVAVGEHGRLFFAVFDPRNFVGETPDRSPLVVSGVRQFKKTTNGRGFLS